MQKGVTHRLPAAGGPVAFRAASVFAECMTVFDEHPRARRGAGGRSPAAWRSSTPPAPNTRRSPTASTASRASSAARDGYAIEAQVGTVLSGLGFPAARLEAAHRGVLRRLADAHRARQAAAGKAEPAAARRADEPPGPGSPQLAGGVSETYPNAFVLVSHDRYFLDVTCPQDRRNVEQGRPLLHRRLHADTNSRRPSGARNSKPPTRTSRTASGSSKPSSTASAIRRPRPSRYRAASRSWSGSSASRFRPKKRPSISAFPQPKPSGRIVAEFKGVAKSYGDHAGVFGRRFLHRARRPRRAGGREWRGQIDADQDSGGRGAGDFAANTCWATTRSPIISRRISTRSWTRTPG